VKEREREMRKEDSEKRLKTDSNGVKECERVENEGERKASEREREKGGEERYEKRRYEKG
jgi:hypothetical protein